VTAALIVVGLGVSVWSGLRLSQKEELAVPLNPCGVNRSPYGEVFAMALQGPINKNFHVGMFGATPEEMAILNKEHQHEAPPKPGSLLIVKPDPEEEARKQAIAAKHRGILDRMQVFIDEMNEGHVRRTNPLPASDLLKFYLRRQAEDKLRFAYRLDPSHYANYAALHFFLIEGITTRPELAAGAAQLARETIDYCLSIDYDPRPALTAAAACTHILHIMFTAERLNEEKQYSPDEMQAVLDELDVCIEAYHRIAADWDKNGNWQRISTQRFQECNERIHFVTNIRNAAEKTIERIRNTYAK